MNEMNITFREATVDDVPSIVQQIIDSTDDLHPDDEWVENTAKRWTGYIEGTHTPRFGKEPRITYLAFDNSILIGHVACHHSTKQGCQSELQSIFVHLQSQRKGIGTRLLLMAVEWLVSTGIKSMMVGFHSNNPYQRFYLKYGGVKTALSRCEWHDLSQLQRLLREVDIIHSLGG